VAVLSLWLYEAMQKLMAALDRVKVLFGFVPPS
jgi:hypothetical protein